MKRSGIMLACLVLASASLLTSSATAGQYQWIDAQGEVHVVSDITMVPPQHRQAALADAKERAGGGSFGTGLGDTQPAPPAAAQPTGSDAPSTVIGGHDETWWRSRAFDLQQEIDELERDLEQARAEEADYTGKVLRRPGDGPGHSVGPRDRRHRRRAAALATSGDDEDDPSVEDLQDMLADAESEYQQLHEQARRAGVPPGWLR